MMNHKPIRNPDARLRLLRRAADIIATDEAFAPTAAMRLAERGLATTERTLAEYADFRQRLTDLADGTRAVADFVDVDRCGWSSADEVEAWYVSRLERDVRHHERVIAGA